MPNRKAKLRIREASNIIQLYPETVRVQLRKGFGEYVESLSLHAQSLLQASPPGVVEFPNGGYIRLVTAGGGAWDYIFGENLRDFMGAAAEVHNDYHAIADFGGYQGGLTLQQMLDNKADLNVQGYLENLQVPSGMSGRMRFEGDYNLNSQAVHVNTIFGLDSQNYPSKKGQYFILTGPGSITHDTQGGLLFSVFGDKTHCNIGDWVVYAGKKGDTHIFAIISNEEIKATVSTAGIVKISEGADKRYSLASGEHDGDKVIDEAALRRTMKDIWAHLARQYHCIYGNIDIARRNLDWPSSGVYQTSTVPGGVDDILLSTHQNNIYKCISYSPGSPGGSHEWQYLGKITDAAGYIPVDGWHNDYVYLNVASAQLATVRTVLSSYIGDPDYGNIGVSFSGVHKTFVEGDLIFDMEVFT